MIRMVVFDMAGTTVNENNVVYITLREAINQRGFAVTLNQVLKEGAGKEKSDAIKSILREHGETRDEVANEIYTSFVPMLAHAYATLDILPQENALEVFHGLRKRHIIVVLNTGYQSATAFTLINKLGWKQSVHFDALVTASDVEKSRPSPDMIWLAMAQSGIESASEVAKVGDSIIDILEGQNAGCSITVGITTGAHTPEQLRSANPTYIIHNLKELLPLLP